MLVSPLERSRSRESTRRQETLWSLLRVLERDAFKRICVAGRLQTSEAKHEDQAQHRHGRGSDPRSEFLHGDLRLREADGIPHGRVPVDHRGLARGAARRCDLTGTERTPPRRRIRTPSSSRAFRSPRSRSGTSRPSSSASRLLESCSPRSPRGWGRSRSPSSPTLAAI